jgi:dipeptidase D
MGFASSFGLSENNSRILDELIGRHSSPQETITDFWRMMILCFNLPRPSTNFDGVEKPERSVPFQLAMKAVCKSYEMFYKEDSAGNIIISNRQNQKARYCFQGHMDVVVSKNESVIHDFESEGVDVRTTENGTIKPIKGITLGADNGVAIACGLAVLINNKDIPLELLITKNEETSFDGACGLDAAMISADVILNLDSEVESAICVGSAGGYEQHLYLDLNRSHSEEKCFALKLRDLKGGHSGIDIDTANENAVLLMARICLVDGIRIQQISGGSSTNAIPRECTCLVSGADEAIAQIHKNFEILKSEISRHEDAVKLEVVPVTESHSSPFTKESTRQILSVILSATGGVIKRDSSTGDVESSYNLGLVSTTDNTVSIKYLVRSTCLSWMQSFSRQLTLIGESNGARVEAFKGYFGAWEPNFGSNILQKLKDTHPGGKCPKVYTVHAGLECCTILERFEAIGRKGVECASIGPQIEHAHSPDECLYIDSAERFVAWVEAVVNH